jgi:hypothetical protein
MNPEDRVCFVCLRLKASEILRAAHSVWPDEQSVARRIGLEAARIISQCYFKKPTFFCGKPNRTLLGGLFYLLGLQQGAPVTQEHLHILDVTPESIKISKDRWVVSFPELFSDFEFREDSNVVRMYFRGRPAHEARAGISDVEGLTLEIKRLNVDPDPYNITKRLYVLNAGETAKVQDSFSAGTRIFPSLMTVAL